MIIKKNRYSVTQDTLDIQQDQFLNSSVIEKHTDNELLNHALHYASIGYPVFPLQGVRNLNEDLSCTCKGGLNCSASGKHPRTRHGLKDATTEKERILNWWQKHPNSNIGLLTGKEVGCFVLDIDVKHGGELYLEELQEVYRQKLGINFVPLPATLTTNTGSGGRHLYFKHPMRFSINNSESEISKGLDIRGENGYVVAPPSKHICGQIYDWFGFNTPIDDAPNWLIREAIMKKQNKPEKQKQVLARGTFTNDINGEKILEGARHIYLFRKISGWVNDFSKEAGLVKALKLNEQMFEPPLADSEVSDLVDDVYKRYGKSKSKNMGIKK